MTLYRYKCICHIEEAGQIIYPLRGRYKCICPLEQAGQIICPLEGAGISSAPLRGQVISSAPLRGQVIYPLQVPQRAAGENFWISRGSLKGETFTQSAPQAKIFVY